ncbi:energy-coupling factor ABC transporter ATP-binding protein [Serratia fonticola]|nr:energy-coupling factor ABC transporter ATP-binding protein [Serratia fonticola]NYA41118.1 energy-coupling factor ABC transporter ATP-binding protein [Serratia fonticola]
MALNALSFIPQGSRWQLESIELHCEVPGLYGISGGNGSGKTTLSQLLAGCFPDFLPGTIQGSGLVLGEEIGSRPLVEMAQQVQLIQQAPQLQLSGCTFTVEEEIAFGPENLCLDEAEIMGRIEQALTFTDCHTLRHRHPATLSGGEAQRVVMACALAMRPRLLLLDEAFSRLTPDAATKLLQQLASYASQEHCVIMLFERSLTKVTAYCLQTYALEQGRLSLC